MHTNEDPQVLLNQALGVLDIQGQILGKQLSAIQSVLQQMADRPHEPLQTLHVPIVSMSESTMNTELAVNVYRQSAMVSTHLPLGQKLAILQQAMEETLKLYDESSDG